MGDPGPHPVAVKAFSCWRPFQVAVPGLAGVISVCFLLLKDALSEWLGRPVGQALASELRALHAQAAHPQSGEVSMPERWQSGRMRRGAKPLYGLTPVPRVRVPPSPPDFQLLTSLTCCPTCRSLRQRKTNDF